jgi:integrase
MNNDDFKKVEKHYSVANHNLSLQLQSITSRRLMGTRHLRIAPKPISVEEFKAFLETVAQDPSAADLRDAARIIFHTGLRIGELASQKWENVDVGRNRLRVVQDKGFGFRYVPFGSVVSDVLARRRALDPSAVFVFGRDDLASVNRAKVLVRKLKSHQAGANIGFHSLRVAFIQRWIKNGGNIEQLALIAGFSLPKGITKSHLGSAAMLDLAAEFQARLEEEF